MRRPPALRSLLMNVVIFGATGMVGRGVLRECLRTADVELVEPLGTPTGQSHPKLDEFVHANLWDYTSVESQLTGFDACSSVWVCRHGMSEANYTHLTYDRRSQRRHAGAPESGNDLVYVSGAGTDSSKSSRQIWPRVKGRTETRSPTALQSRLPVPARHHPAVHGIR